MTVPFSLKDGTNVNIVKYITTRYAELKVPELGAMCPSIN
jgi:hypothetical protein